jgi:hypothetical protein
MIKLTEQQVQEICGAFANMDGGYLLAGITAGGFADYPNCKNAMGRIIEVMDDDIMSRYVSHLRDVYCEGKTSVIFSWNLHKATSHQQFVAAAMALGLLNEGEK